MKGDFMRGNVVKEGCGEKVVGRSLMEDRYYAI